MREVVELFAYYDRLKIQIEEETNKRLKAMDYICPHCKKENITVHYKEPFKWCVENRENNTFILNILFFCDSCFQKFEQMEEEKTGE